MKFATLRLVSLLLWIPALYFGGGAALALASATAAVPSTSASVASEPLFQSREHWNAEAAPQPLVLEKRTHLLFAGESVTLTSGSLVVILRPKDYDADADAAAAAPPPPGEFCASWMSHGVKIEVRATQRDNEGDGAFATRCKNKVLVFEANFPRDAQGANTNPGPDWTVSGTARRTGGHGDAGGADWDGAHDWSAAWETHEAWNGHTGVAGILLWALQYDGETDAAFATRCAPKVPAFLAEFPNS